MRRNEADDDAFARWDRSHLSLFTLNDGRVVTDEDTGADIAASGFGSLIVPLDLAVAKVARVLKLGAEFQYTFDLGDYWTHRCTVGTGKIDPSDEVGIVPGAPLPYWGRGSIPDQYGRRWADDDGEGPVPKRPGKLHPMLLHTWPVQELIPSVDVRELRGAIARGDAARFLAAVVERDIDEALQLVGAGIHMMLKQRRQDAEPVAFSVINRLFSRGGAGDQVLADDLLAVLRGEPLAGRVVPVDLDMLSAELGGDLDFSIGGYIDLRTGGVYDDTATDPATVGDGSAIDVDEEPEQWDAYSTDRQWGRARAFLADEGIRVG